MVGGVSTEGGVEATIRHGAYLGYFMIVIEDCVGSRNKDLHEAALKYMKRTFQVSTLKELVNIWRQTKK